MIHGDDVDIDAVEYSVPCFPLGGYMSVPFIRIIDKYVDEPVPPTTMTPQQAAFAAQPYPSIKISAYTCPPNDNDDTCSDRLVVVPDQDIEITLDKLRIAVHALYVSLPSTICCP